MTHRRLSPHGFWSGRLALVLAVTGSTVGLGNVWKFPYLAAQNGGGAFVLVYLGCVALIGLPLMVAELMLGRRGRGSPVTTLRTVALEEGRSPLWGLAGWLALTAGFLILSTYSVVAGWALAYVFRSAGGLFNGLDPLGAARLFRELTSDPERLIAWHTVFMVVTVGVVARGVRHGIEEAVRWFVPALLAILVALAVYAHRFGAFPEAVAFLFVPDFEALGAEALLAAMGHAFFSLSLGMGALIAYGSYTDDNVQLLPMACTVVVLDTAVALLAGLVIFPLALASSLELASGPGLVFQVLPTAFGTMPGGAVVGTLFFAVLVLAAWTSAISLLEPAVAFAVERLRIDRGLAATLVGGAAWLLGVGSLLSFNLWSRVRATRELPLLGDQTLFEFVNTLATSVLLPVSGLLLALFVGWRLSAMSARVELGDGWGYGLWLFTLRLLTPLGMLVVLLHALGVPLPWIDGPDG